MSPSLSGSLEPRRGDDRREGDLLPHCGRILRRGNGRYCGYVAGSASSPTALENAEVFPLGSVAVAV